MTAFGGVRLYSWMHILGLRTWRNVGDGFGPHVPLLPVPNTGVQILDRIEKNLR